MFGLDGQWRASRALTLEGQLALDDLQYENTGGDDRYPSRWAFTLAASGPLGSRLGWRAFYTQASSLAFRTLSPFESFTDAGVGLGRNFADMDQLSALATVPVGTRWLLTPELTVLRQGEGEINDPFPATPAEAGEHPAALHRRGGAHLPGGGGRERPAGPARPPRQRRGASRRQCRPPGGPHGESLRGPAPGHAGRESRGSAPMTALPPLPRDRVLQLIGRMKGSRVVVVGDIMIDRYLVGETERLSPEAPVPVVTIHERHSALGGAANVAANVVGDGRHLPARRRGGRRHRRRRDPAEPRHREAGRPVRDPDRGPPDHLEDPDHRPVPADRADRRRGRQPARGPRAGPDDQGRPRGAGRRGRPPARGLQQGRAAPRADRGGHGDRPPAGHSHRGGPQVPPVLRVCRGHRVQAQPPRAGVGAGRGGGPAGPERAARGAHPAQGGQPAGDAGTPTGCCW